MKAFFFAVLLSIVQAAPPIPRQAADNNNPKAQKVKKESNGEKTKPLNPATIQETVTAPAAKTNRENDTNNNHQEPVRITEFPPVSITSGWRDNLTLFFTFLLLIIGGLGVCAAYRTLRAIEKQTRHLRKSVIQAKRSADAAFKQITLLISKERPRIHIEAIDLELWPDPSKTPASMPQPPRIVQAKYKIYCHGATPAFIQEANHRLEVTDSREVIPNSFLLPMRISPVLNPTPDGAEYTALLFESAAEKCFQSIREGKRFAHFYGFIKYRDVFEKERQTKFRFIWQSSSFGFEIGKWIKHGTNKDNEETEPN